jgi:hypothetical protein
LGLITDHNEAEIEFLGIGHMTACSIEADMPSAF